MLITCGTLEEKPMCPLLGSGVEEGRVAMEVGTLEVEL